MKDIQKLLKTINSLKKAQDKRLSDVFENINKLPDNNMQEFFKNSVSLAQKGELNLDGFLEKAKTLMNDADGNNSK